MSTTENYFIDLRQHGIKGMKWGQRKQHIRTGRVRKAIHNYIHRHDGESLVDRNYRIARNDLIKSSTRFGLTTTSLLGVTLGAPAVTAASTYGLVAMSAYGVGKMGVQGAKWSYKKLKER